MYVCHELIVLEKRNQVIQSRNTRQNRATSVGCYRCMHLTTNTYGNQSALPIQSRLDDVQYEECNMRKYCTPRLVGNT